MVPDKEKQMKKLLTYFAVILVSVIAVSCGDDDPVDNTVVNGKTVVGVWRSTEPGWDGYQMLTLSPDGNYTLVEIDNESSNWSETGTYTVDGSVMTRVSSDADFGVEVYTILTLTETKMITRYEGQRVGQYSDGSIDEWTRVE